MPWLVPDVLAQPLVSILTSEHLEGVWTRNVVWHRVPDESGTTSRRSTAFRRLDAPKNVAREGQPGMPWLVPDLLARHLFRF